MEWMEAEENRDDTEYQLSQFIISHDINDTVDIDVLLKRHIEQAETIKVKVSDYCERNPEKSPFQEESLFARINILRTKIFYHLWQFRQVKTCDDKRNLGETLQALHDENCEIIENLAALTQESFYAGRCDFPCWNSMEERRYDALIAKRIFDLEFASCNVFSAKFRKTMIADSCGKLSAEYRKAITENEERYHIVLRAVKIWKGQHVFAGAARCLLLTQQKNLTIMNLNLGSNGPDAQKMKEEILELLESIYNNKLEFAEYMELHSQAGAVSFRDWIKAEEDCFEARRECFHRFQ